MNIGNGSNFRSFGFPVSWNSSLCFLSVVVVNSEVNVKIWDGEKSVTSKILVVMIEEGKLSGAKPY